MFPRIDADALYVWVMALLRAGGLVSILPVFSAPAVPAQMRLALAVFLAWLAHAYVAAHSSIPEHFAGLAFAAGNELLLGVFMGMIVKIIFYAAEMTGQIVANEVGLTSGATLDPGSGNNFSAMSALFSNLAALLLLTSGAYRTILFAYLRSYAYAPVGNMALRPGTADLFVEQTGRIFLISVQMSAPVIATNFIATLALGVLGKVAPGLNVFMEGHSVRILVGLSVLGLTIALSAQHMLGFLENAPDLMLQLVRR